jgi:hypothetical protein
MAAGITKGKGWWKKCFQQRYPESGLAVEAFCKQEQVALSTFYTWRKRLLAEEKSIEAKPEPVRAEDSLPASSNKGHLFIPIHLSNKRQNPSFAQSATKDSTNKLEIILANGNIVRLQASQSQILEILDLVV